MKRNPVVCLLVTFVMVVNCLATPERNVRAAGIILYAASGGLTSGTCNSWANACDLQYALSVAVSTDEIWVRQGTYKPTTGADRTISFVLKNGVSLYGGFAGTESLRSQRASSATLTILSGDIGVEGTVTDNSHHVVIASGITNATMDGFTITGGYTSVDIDNPFLAVNTGGGMKNENGSPVLYNIIFTANASAYGDGGGMSNWNGSPLLTNVTFKNNTAYRGGGGLLNIQSNPVLTNVTFSGNSSLYGHGGGVENYGGDPTLTNVTFSGNSVTTGYGGGMFNFGGSPTLNHVTFNNNAASYSGGALYNHSSATPNIYNSIFWGNSPQEILNDGLVGINTSIIKDSVVAGGCPIGGVCTHIINVDPNLGTLTDNGGLTQTTALGAGSSAIDTGGKNSTCATSDQRGATRPQGSGCDIGAYEANAPTALVNSILPTSRSVAVGTTATVYHSVINAGASTAYGVVLSMMPAPAGVFAYQQTNCITNAVVGSMNPILDIPAHGLLCYALFFTPSAPFAATAVHIQAQAINAPSTTLLPGINTWLLRAANSAGPDIIALTNPTSGQTLSSCSMLYAFSISLANVGTAASQITAIADTGSAILPIAITIYETNGALLEDNILTNVDAGETRTLAVYVLFGGCIPFDPAANRIFVRFVDVNGNVVGSTSTAVSAQPYP